MYYVIYLHEDIHVSRNIFIWRCACIMNYICMKLYMYYVIQLHEDMHVVCNIFTRRHTWLQSLGSGVLMIWVGGTSLHQRLFRSSRRHIDLNTMLLVVGCCSRLQKSICPYDCDSNQYSELVLTENQSLLCFLLSIRPSLEGRYDSWWRVEQLFDQNT